MRIAIIGTALAVGLTLFTGSAAATATVAKCDWTQAKLNVSKTLYRTATGWTPKGSIPSGTVIIFYYTKYSRLSVPSRNGYIAPGGMTVIDGGTCPS
ncbi:hypothetical protein [Nonomuraea harbinensis]|uniref:Uncharacterized protein n=1 Tax=Nonomuraea harbinensis TaxID=1286938 RepID=A0ABW1BZR5_9ACTN|nr:hypothetical protein [Nonomuraea harbinensis]